MARIAGVQRSVDEAGATGFLMALGATLVLTTALPAVVQAQHAMEETGSPVGPGPSAEGATPAPTPAIEAEDKKAEPAADSEPPEEPHDHYRAFYLEFSSGWSWLDVGIVDREELVPELERLKGNGWANGAGFGFFVSILTLGIQTEIALHDEFNVGTVALDLGLRGKAPFVEPYFRLGLGYIWLFSPNGTVLEEFFKANKVRGLVADIGLGFDFMITPLWAVGIGADAAIFNVRRSGRDSQVGVTEHGDSVGIQTSGLLQVNMHF